MQLTAENVDFYQEIGCLMVRQIINANQTEERTKL